MFRSVPASRDVHSAPALYFPMGSHGLAMAAMPTATHAPRGHGWTRDAAAAVRSLPDALRCGYTSKRCENPRTVKKSGGLHRFCAYHRERANKNQWRVDNRRRQLRKMGQSATKSASDAGSPRSTTSEAVDEAELCEDDHTDSGKGEDDSGENSMISLTDPAGSPNTLSDQDAKILNAMLFSDEDEPSSVDAVTVPLVGNENVGEKRTFESLEPSCEASVSMDASWNCVCSQCLAWSTVLFYSDSLEAARSARVQKHARV